MDEQLKIMWQESLNYDQALEEGATREMSGPSPWRQAYFRYAVWWLVCKSCWKPSSDLDDATEVSHRSWVHICIVLLLLKFWNSVFQMFWQTFLTLQKWTWEYKKLLLWGLKISHTVKTVGKIRYPDLKFSSAVSHYDASSSVGSPLQSPFHSEELP